MGFFRTRSRINKVTTSSNKSIKKLKSAFLVHRTQHAFPGLAQAHGTELQRRDTDASGLGEDSVPTQRSGRVGCGFEEGHGCLFLRRGMRVMCLVDRRCQCDGGRQQSKERVHDLSVTLCSGPCPAIERHLSNARWCCVSYLR
jgi:hypothetical protein